MSQKLIPSESTVIEVEQSEAPQIATLDDLLAEFSTPDDTFTFTLPGGKKQVVARRLADATDLVALRKHAELVWKMCLKGGMDDWRPFLPAAKEVVSAAVFCESLLVDPKVPFVEGLKIGKTCGGLLLTLAGETMKRVQGLALEAEEEALEDAKNG